MVARTRTLCVNTVPHKVPDFLDVNKNRNMFAQRYDSAIPLQMLGRLLLLTIPNGPAFCCLEGRVRRNELDADSYSSASRALERSAIARWAAN
jgi:hypothetical protein